MCSSRNLVEKKEPVKFLGDMTARDLLQFVISIQNPLDCRLLLTNSDLSILLRLKLKTINHYSSQNPERLPPKFDKPGSRGVRYLLCDWYKWSKLQVSGEAPPPPPPPPAPAAPEKRSPGRPRLSSSVNP